MSESTPSKTPSRSNSPIPIAWFEFLLDPNLLEAHLYKENPDPSAIQLIIQFLANTPQQPQENKENERDTSTPDVESTPDGRLPGENRKFQALLQLSLKTAAFLKWNLDILRKGLPFSMVYALLSSFLDLTFKDFPVPAGKKIHEMDFSELPLEGLFALQLYHRWCVLAVIDETFPKRPPSAMAVSLPGQSDPTNIPPAVIESILKNIKELLPDSVECLEEFLKKPISLQMPTIDCISCFTHQVDAVEHDWDKGFPIKPEELTCQISYDVGCYHFFQENYPKALERLTEVYHLCSKIKDPTFLVIDNERLHGYLKALNFMEEINKQELSLVQKVEVSRKHNFEGIVPLLMQDTFKEELPWSYRNYTEYEMDSGKYGTNSDLQFQVYTCNFVNCLMKGRAVSPSYMELLTKQNKSNIDFFIKILGSALCKGTLLQKKNAKMFLSYLCHSYFTSDIVNHIVSSYLSQFIDMSDIQVSHQNNNGNIYQPITDPIGFTDNVALRIGDLERKLCLSYDSQEIKALIVQLSSLSFAPKKQLWTINYKWEIARELHQQVVNLPYELQDVVLILLSKAKECMNLKRFSTAKELLLFSESESKDFFRMVKLVKWELLFCDLLEMQSDCVSNSDCTRKVKTCLTALSLDADLVPRSEIVEQCAAFLLNLQDWDYLISTNHHNNGHLIFSSYLASVCRMTQANKVNRSTAEEFWESVLQIFYLNAQQKRSSTGLMTSIYRENSFACMSRANFNLFILKVKDELPLGILLSCLSKIFNILRDDVSTDVYLEYSNLWPTVLRDAGAYSLPGLYDSLKDLLKHVLSVNPVHPGWLRSHGDFLLGQNQYAPALKHYLEAGVVGSDFFSVQVPKTIFDDQVHHRMIRCCSQLQCYTQVAVLCQFLEEIDYAMAFKALQEKGSNDSMDTYCNYIWDIAILEFLIYIHSKRGELDKKQLALKAIGQLELNASNHEEILNQAMQIRKSKFLRAMAKQYL